MLRRQKAPRIRRSAIESATPALSKRKPSEKKPMPRREDERTVIPASPVVGFDETALWELTFEFEFTDPNEAERKIKRRVRERKLGPYDAARIQRLRAFKDVVQKEIHRPKSKYYLGLSGRYADVGDYDLRRSPAPNSSATWGATYRSVVMYGNNFPRRLWGPIPARVAVANSCAQNGEQKMLGLRVRVRLEIKLRRAGNYPEEWSKKSCHARDGGGGPKRNAAEVFIRHHLLLC